MGCRAWNGKSKGLAIDGSGLDVHNIIKSPWHVIMRKAVRQVHVFTDASSSFAVRYAFCRLYTLEEMNRKVLCWLVFSRASLCAVKGMTMPRAYAGSADWSESNKLCHKANRRPNFPENFLDWFHLFPKLDWRREHRCSCDSLKIDERKLEAPSDSTCVYGIQSHRSRFEIV